MYGASYYAAEYYNAEYYGAEGGISSVVGAFGEWQPVERKFRDERKEIREATKRATIRREEPVEEITLAQLFPEERFPLVDPRAFVVNDEQDMEDLVIGLIRAGII